jgi:hypothetical protein
MYRRVGGSRTRSGRFGQAKRYYLYVEWCLIKYNIISIVSPVYAGSTLFVFVWSSCLLQAMLTAVHE